MVVDLRELCCKRLGGKGLVKDITLVQVRDEDRLEYSGTKWGRERQMDLRCIAQQEQQDWAITWIWKAKGTEDSKSLGLKF